MKWLMKLLGIDPGLSQVRIGADLRAFQMDDDQKLETLRQFCREPGRVF